MIEKSVSLMDKLGTALLSTKVVGESEPSVFETNVLSMVLDRQTPSTLVKKRLQWDDGGSGVSFPSQETLIQTMPFPVHSLDAQVSDEPLGYDMAVLAFLLPMQPYRPFEFKQM